MATLSFKVARAMISVFDLMYKMGVEHAHNAYSDDEIIEFIERTESPAVFGILGKGEVFSWLKWKSQLYFWAIELSDKKLEHIYEYIKDSYDLKSPYACFYPITFRFYTQGITDRMQYPISDGELQKFKRMRHVKLAEYIDRRVSARKIKEKQYIGLVQHYAYELAELEGNRKRKGCIGSSRYHKFAEIFWQVITAYRAYRKSDMLQRRLEKTKDEEIWTRRP